MTVQELKLEEIYVGMAVRSCIPPYGVGYVVRLEAETVFKTGRAKTEIYIEFPDHGWTAHCEWDLCQCEIVREPEQLEMNLDE